MAKLFSVVLLSAFVVLAGCACHKPVSHPPATLDEYGGK